MLWTCERYSTTKWNSYNLISICRMLIHRFVTNVKSSVCRSFFVTRQNLLDNVENTDELKHFVRKLMNLTDESLCLWLIDNYIRQCIEQCPHYSLRRFRDNPTIQLLPHALSFTADWRRSRFDEISCTDFGTACNRLQQLFSSFIRQQKATVFMQIHHRTFACNRFTTVDFFYAICSLKVSSLLDRGHSALKMADAIRTLIQSSVCVFSDKDSKMVERLNDGNSKQLLVALSGAQSFTVCKHFRSAAVLLLTTRQTHNNFSTLSKLFTELSKIYLHSALQCTNMECRDIP
jgi:hypothetical protein